MCTARARPTATRGAAQLGLGRRSTRGPRSGLARPASAARARVTAHSDAARGGGAARLPYGGDLTGARETAGESVAGLTGAWTATRHDGVDGGVG
jgi:hypothetical protein